MKVLIKYCGGCNPRYDRAKLVRNLQNVFQTPLYRYTMHNDVFAAVVVCGCSCACASVDELKECKYIFKVSGEQDFEGLCEFMKTMENEYSSRKEII